MTGSSDGIIKIFRNYESEKQVEVVSAFRALTDIVPSNKNAGLVFDWQQGQGKLLVAGDVKVIRVWNAATEICTNVKATLQHDPAMMLTKAGYTRALWILYYFTNLGPSRRQRFCRWLWGWCDSCLRSAVETGHGNDQSLA